MKVLKVLFVQLLFLIVFYFSAAAQSDTAVLNHIMTKTAKLYNSFPTEKLYLHFDKPYYALGDTIWFKAYLTIDQHQLSPLSKIIYVDILGPRDSLIEALKLQVKNGVAWGTFPISQYVYKKGNYRVVAFSNWMNNGDPAYFFNKNITIGDAINNDLSTQISFKRTEVNKVPKISAHILYKDGDGNPYSEKKVNWTVEKDYETLIKGKGITDKNGFINISFSNTKNYGLDSAIIITEIDNNSHKQFTSTFPLKSVSAPNDLQFFAEGGQLITGLSSKVAFKAVSPNGLGIDAKGTIIDNNNTVVAEFASTHLGMGVFVFKPEEGKTYTAKVTFADGTTVTPDLPKIQTGAICLSVENSDPDNLKLRIQADLPFVKQYQGKTFFILAKSNGVIYFAAKTQLQNQVYNASIPKSKFPTGIVQVTLFTEDGDPISERIAFIKHDNDLLNIAVSGDHPSYTTRQMVKLNVLAKNSDQPAQGEFSMSVVDDAKVPYDDDAETTILTNLLLTSDIKGYIEKPNYYFNHPDAKTVADLDVLLLTQGYRRFSYDGIMNDKYPAIRYLPETGINISGTLRASNGIPVANGNIRLFIADKNFSANTTTNTEGRFAFTNLTFSDSAKVSLSARNNARASELVLTVDGDQGQRIPVNYNTPDQIINIDSTLSVYLKNSKIQYNNTNVLKEVVIRDTKIVKTVSHKDYGSLASLSSEADHTINGNMLTGCANVLECIRSMAPGMTYENDNFYVMRDYSQGKRIPAALFLRGQPIDVNTLNSINASEIESVEIFLKDELGLVNSAYGTNGAIVINMKKAPEGQKISLQELKSLIPQQNEVNYTPKGYAKIRTFYLPRYSGPRETQPNKTDTRSTIYWNPNIITDKTGNATVEYFNSDGKGTYRVIVEGIDKDGNIGRQLFRYSVK
ncbi:carboxypeptidase family protein [Mucilaginibacter frigoritolerans]|uniref:Carboxypeptidase family protein n=1 Tax=Mucilaginibacter frigoritolerans TaxID=652788 RepID=A0A562TX94_9SPHI|nr:carboxypeptidase regulatory-like domain-containing protein [Mucilaginibacter frigoritolerans]TWI98063.1 carboxypeptidase family protein [Mucilaginibacter frigoritolerans]